MYVKENMNRVNKIKRKEKEILVHFLNIISLIKNAFFSFIKFFANVGNQKITIMFIPHSEKKVFNFRVNLFLIFLVLFLSLSTIGIISLLSIDNYKKSISYKNANLMTQLNEKRSREYEEMINEIIENHRIFKTKLDILLAHIDSNTIRSMQENNMNQGGPFNKVDTSLMSEFEIEKMEAKKLLYDYQYSIQAFSEINKMASNYKKLLQDLPFGCPVKGPYIITSNFGLRIHPIHKVLDMHQGLDLAYQAGTPIVATAPGILEKIEWDPFGYGWYCRISHKLGYSTMYAHLRSHPVVELGQKVKKGQIIGYMGRTGATTGVHVHYEVRLGNNLMDPWKFVTIF